MCNVWQCVAVCCACCTMSHAYAVCCSALQCVAVRCSVLQRVAVCCSALQCIAVCCVAVRWYVHNARWYCVCTIVLCTHNTFVYAPWLQSWLLRTLKPTFNNNWQGSVKRVDCKVHILKSQHTLQHTAAHCNTLQHTATRCSTLQHAAAHCNTLQHTATRCSTIQRTAIRCNTLHHAATHRLQVDCKIEIHNAFTWDMTQSDGTCWIVTPSCDIVWQNSLIMGHATPLSCHTIRHYQRHVTPYAIINVMSYHTPLSTSCHTIRHYQRHVTPYHIVKVMSRQLWILRETLCDMTYW